MRFLHTGDWHIGRALRGRSRFDEYAAALQQVLDAATSEGVDALLLAGDIYDQRAVSAESDRLVFELLIKLAEASIPVVAIPGNHDSAARLAALAPLLERVGTHVVHKVVPPDQGGIVHLESRSGDETASVACLPFVSPRRFADAATLFESISDGYVSFDAGMGRVLAAYENAFDDEHVNVVMGHMFVSGSEPGLSEREITIGADYAVSPQHIPATASYVALGHIHKPQKVRGAAADTRYCGSLLQLDFGERGQDKSVLIVDAKPGKPAKVRHVAIDAGRKLMDVDCALADVEKVAAEIGDAFVRVNLTVDRPVPGLADQVRAALPNALDVRLILPQQEESEAPRSLRGLDPRDQFVQYYEHSHQAGVPEEILVAFDRVYEDVVG